MSAIDISVVDALLQELAPDAPCGDDLEYDPMFLEFEIAAKGKPEEQYGETIKPAVLPEWKTVQSLALQLLERSRDLRLAVPLTRALIHQQGIAGFAIGLHLLEQLLKQRWDSVHPQLDPDDDNDPMARINALAALAEPSMVLREFKETALVNSRLSGAFTLRDIDIATGEQVVAEDVVKPSLSLIEGAFADIDLNELQAVHDALAACCASIVSIEANLTEKVGAAQALNLGPLLKMVERARRFVAEQMAARGAGPAADSEADYADESADAPAGGGVMQRVVHDEIANREDVRRALDKICAYYSRYEPSSPVPLLLQRASRLVDKSFIEILEDLAPEGLNQVYTVSGAPTAS